MKITRAVKVAGIAEQLDKILNIAEICGINGLEIATLPSLIEKNCFEYRGDIIVKALRKHGKMNTLMYHFPIGNFVDIKNNILNVDIKKLKKYDLASKQGKYVLELTNEIMLEAYYVAEKLNFQGDIPIIVHVYGTMNEFNLLDNKERQEAIKKRDYLFETSAEKLKDLRKFGEKLSKNKRYNLKITLENNAIGPYYSLCCDARDVKKMSKKVGIEICLDLAHLKLTQDYLNISLEHLRSLKGELFGGELLKTIYPEKLTLEKSIKLLAPSVNSLHLNDVKNNFNFFTEGCEIGKGDFPFKYIFPLIVKNLKKERIIGTYEITNGHLAPLTMQRSDKKLREYLGEEFFQKYFI